jgi:hypothetical protein
MKQHDVEVRMDDHGRGRVFIDGQELHSVTHVSFGATVGERNTLRLEVLPRAFVVTGPAGVRVCFPRGVVGWETDL